MGEQIVLGNISVKVAAEDFSKGYQEGYLRITTHYQGKPLTYEDVYNFLAQSICNIMTTDSHRAGYITGWRAALHGHDKPVLIADCRTVTQQQV